MNQTLDIFMIQCTDIKISATVLCYHSNPRLVEGLGEQGGGEVRGGSEGRGQVSGGEGGDQGGDNGVGEEGVGVGQGVGNTT